MGNKTIVSDLNLLIWARPALLGGGGGGGGAAIPHGFILTEGQSSKLA
jgi:hypothetical protein